MTEDEVLAWLRSRPGTALIGDDTAALPDPAGWIVTVDQQVEGVHVPEWLDPERRGRRLVAVNLSDLAAAGATPAWGFLALAAPRDFPHRRFLDAVAGALHEHGAALAGGDLARAPTPLASLTLLGRVPDSAHPPGRAGARPGDRLWIGGPLGLSALGRRALEHGARPDGTTGPSEIPTVDRATVDEALDRHLAPTAQLELGRWLLGRASASLDVSDGLALDLSRLLRASSGAAPLGARLERETLAPGDVFAASCRALGLDPWQAVLGGGEDYVLLFTLPDGSEPVPDRFGARPIGRIVESEGIRLADPSGRLEPVEASGWDHLADPRPGESFPSGR